MSRIGRKPINIPAGVEVKVNGSEVSVKGPKGALTQTFNPKMNIAVEGSEIRIPAHSCAAIVCSLKEFIETGDHYLYICEVKEVYSNGSEKALFAWNGYAEIRPAE